ncbi:hypothetical protein [Risungbinella massiliensis]|uniref:hypothetical protein n=1 Tax=Risungbinella massiliensis TaxID=1329796 RepID=UPI0012B647B7|nr:hypothetical protein [Risungbinella massiliensis]
MLMQNNESENYFFGKNERLELSDLVSSLSSSMNLTPDERKQIQRLILKYSLVRRA